jgi:hypothetical protein
MLAWDVGEMVAFFVGLCICWHICIYRYISFASGFPPRVSGSSPAGEFGRLDDVATPSTQLVLNMYPLLTSFSRNPPTGGPFDLFQLVGRKQQYNNTYFDFKSCLSNFCILYYGVRAHRHWSAMNSIHTVGTKKLIERRDAPHSERKEGKVTPENIKQIHSERTSLRTDRKEVRIGTPRRTPP